MLARGRTWIALVIGWIVLFVIAGVAANGHSHPTTADNVVWGIVWLSLLLMVLLGVFTLIQTLRSRSRSQAL
jgi:quinol-cytochrome oxidoreductase complex cytochrome b subunit